MDSKNALIKDTDTIMNIINIFNITDDNVLDAFEEYLGIIQKLDAEPSYKELQVLQNG